MRLPIVEYPKIVTASLKHFGPTFQTAAQRRHFCQYVTGLIAGDKGTVQALNNLFLGQQDQSVLNVNRQDPFPVDFRPYHQFRVKYENKKMKETAQALAVEEDLLAHRQHCSGLVELSYSPTTLSA